MDQKGENNTTAEVVANMALAHEMIMNDNFQLKSINDASNRYKFLYFFPFDLEFSLVKHQHIYFVYTAS